MKTFQLKKLTLSLTMAAFLTLGLEGQAIAAPIQQTVTVGGVSTIIISYNAGDTVDIVATLNTVDPNENGEGEPLQLQSTTGFAATVSNYAQPTTFSFTATVGGTLSGVILGFDGDESATVTVTVNSNQKKRFTPQQKDAMAKSSADLAI